MLILLLLLLFFKYNYFIFIVTARDGGDQNEQDTGQRNYATGEFFKHVNVQSPALNI
jgi:hypothetical protein